MNEKNREQIVEGLSFRMGLASAAQGNQYTNMSLKEIAVDRLKAAGEEVKDLGTDELFGRAMNTSDFTNILADVANKALLEGFETAEESYDDWADTTGRCNDFRDHVFARASEAPSLIEINSDGGEYTYGTVSDAKETVAVVDYGIIVPFTRKAMVNDDLDALSDIREKLGAAAKRKYGDLVYAVLTANAAMGDGVALFHANHGNFIDNGSGAIPSVATLNVGAASMAVQTDLQGIQKLNIRPQFILAPWALKGTVDNLLTTTSPIAPGSTLAPVTNPGTILPRFSMLALIVTMLQHGIWPHKRARR